MKNNKYIIPLILFLCSIVSCNDGPTDPRKYPINPYLKEIKFSDPIEVGHNFYMAVWKGNNIYTIDQLAQFTVDNNYDVLHDTILLDIGIYEKPWSYLDANYNSLHHSSEPKARRHQ